MEEEKSSNFIELGTFSVIEANILKPELEKIGIPVKSFYPGTNIGIDCAGGASWIGFTILIPHKDIKRALKVCKRLGIR